MFPLNFHFSQYKAFLKPPFSIIRNTLASWFQDLQDFVSVLSLSSCLLPLVLAQPESQLVSFFSGYTGHMVCLCHPLNTLVNLLCTSFHSNCFMPTWLSSHAKSVYDYIFPTAYMTVYIFHYSFSVNNHKDGLIKREKLLNQRKCLLENIVREIACQCGGWMAGNSTSEMSLKSASGNIEV